MEFEFNHKDTLEKFSLKIKDDINLLEAKLSNEYFYNSITLCIIDAVFSIGVRYTSVQNTVKKYCDYYDVKIFRDRNNSLFPNHENQESIRTLINRIEDLSIQKFTESVFKNKQKTSTKSGILKTEAVLLFAKSLEKNGVIDYTDINKIFTSKKIEESIKLIPGQKSGISFKYFLMLISNENYIKPDRMIIRYFENLVNTKLSESQIIFIVKEVCKLLKKDFENISPRLLDHEIWKYQRSL